MAKQAIKRPSADAVTTAMFRLLNALIKNPEYLNDPRVSESIFTNETAKSVYLAISNLYEQKVGITPASLLQAGQQIDFNVTSQIVQTAFDIDPAGATTLDDILGILKTAVIKDDVLTKLDYLKQKVYEPGEIDKNAILAQLYEIDQEIQNHGKNESTLKTFSELAETYKEDLESRRIGQRYSFGDPLLDKTFPRGARPGNITIITAHSSMGKSTFVLSLMDNCLEANQPGFYLSLEMGTIDTIDRFISKRCGIPNSELYTPENIDTVLDAVNIQQANLTQHRKFYFCEATNVDIIKLRNLIREFKQKAKSDYGLVAIDLLSGMSNFMVSDSGISSAVSIENNLNKLEQLAKEENVHIIGVVQMKRETNLGQMETLAQIDDQRPKLNELKNSSAYAEKGAIVLACHRPKYYAVRYMTSKMSEDELEALPDIMEVQVLKDRNGGAAGKILKYVFDGEYFRVYPLLEDEEENPQDQKLEQLKDLTI